MLRLKSEYAQGVGALILVSMMFASMGIFVRFLQVDFTILQQVYIRIVLATVFSVVLFFPDIQIEKIKKISSKEWGVLLLRAIAVFVLAVPLVSYAFTIGKYSNISFLQALPFAALLGFLLLKERVTAKKIIYISLAFLGVILVSVTDFSNLFSWGMAEMLSILSCFLFSFGYVTRRWHSNLLNNKEITLLVFIIASLMLVGASIFLGEGMPIFSGSTAIFFALLAAAIFNVLISVMTNYGFQKVEAVIASNILTLESVFALLIAIILYQEMPVIKELIGGALIVFSVYKMNKLG